VVDGLASADLLGSRGLLASLALLRGDVGLAAADDEGLEALAAESGGNFELSPLLLLLLLLLLVLVLVLLWLLLLRLLMLLLVVVTVVVEVVVVLVVLLLLLLLLMVVAVEVAIAVVVVMVVVAVEVMVVEVGVSLVSSFQSPINSPSLSSSSGFSACRRAAFSATYTREGARQTNILGVCPCLV
jgi:hypothetical protein